MSQIPSSSPPPFETSHERPDPVPRHLRAIGFTRKAVLGADRDATPMELMTHAVDPDGIVPADPARSLMREIEMCAELLQLACRAPEMDQELLEGVLESIRRKASVAGELLRRRDEDDAAHPCPGGPKTARSPVALVPPIPES